MDKIQASVEKELLNQEKQVLKDIKSIYNKALQDISERVETLQSNILNLQNIDTSSYDEKQLEILNSQIRSKVYQLEYQKMLEKQTSTIIEVLKQDTVANVHSFLDRVYQDSYLGIQYDINMKGIPITVPINPKTVVEIINKKIEDMTFADRINVNMNNFKKKVKSEISRGLARGSTYNEIARNLSMITDEDLYKSTRIVRTECARVSTEAKLESIREMNKKGADLVKQWDSTLDNKTRTTHAKLDQQYTEVDESFKVDGYEVMGPGMFGNPKQDCNCRCVLLSVPRWGIEDTVVKYDNINKKLVKVKNYQEWKDSYCKQLSWYNSLSFEEKTSIIQYISSKSYKINELLYNHNELTKEQQKYIDTLDNALLNAPSYVGDVYRSVDINSQEQLNYILSKFNNDNRTGSWESYLSSSIGVYDHSMKLQFIIKSKSGKNISMLNDEGFGEIVFLRNTKFKLMKCYQKNGKIVVILEELL